MTITPAARQALDNLTSVMREVGMADFEAAKALKAERDHLATLLDGVLADDTTAIRDAAAWLAANRPEVDG